MQLCERPTTTSNPTITTPDHAKKPHMVWVKKTDASMREYLMAVWTTQD